MGWSPESLIGDFERIAEIAGVRLEKGDIAIEKLLAPHKAPSRIPSGKMAVYIFSFRDQVLKVGKAGPKSQARYTSQHYNPSSAASTLAKSLLNDSDLESAEIDEIAVGDWIKKNTDRINLLINENLGIHVLTLLESFAQCRLQPRYEGFASQRK